MVPVLKGDTAATQAMPNYNEWFNRQDSQEQMEILGPARYKEFLNGKDVTQFADGDKILTLEDLFGEEQIYRTELNKLLYKQILSQNIRTVVLDETTDIISYARDLQFRITENGIVFIFQNYEIASYAEGAIFLTIPYGELEPFLLLEFLP